MIRGTVVPTDLWCHIPQVRGNPNQSGKRTSDEYAAIKKSLEEKLLRGLYRNSPKCNGKVSYVSIGSPLTNQYVRNMDLMLFCVEMGWNGMSGEIDPGLQLTELTAADCTM